MTKCDTVLFDLGHTLMDFRSTRDDLLEVYDEARRRLLAGAKQDIPTLEDIVEIIPKKVVTIIDDSYRGPRAIEELEMSQVIAQAFESINVQLPEPLVQEMLLLEHEALSRSMTLSDGARDVLAQLKRWGFKLGLVSNATNLPHLLRRDLDRLGILVHFDATVFSSELGLRKPHPTIYHAALSGVASEPTTTIFIGDRIREDIWGPQALGMRAVLTHEFRQESPNGSKPDTIISHVSELLDFIRRMSSI